MNANRLPRTHENVPLTWDDNPEGDDRPYMKDDSIIRRHYGALMRNRFGSYGHMSVLVPHEPGSVGVEDFEVDASVRNQGIGSMILRSALAHLKQEGHTEFFSEEVGPTALYVRRGVLGEDMQFYEHRDPNRTPINKTFDEAIRNAYQAEHDRKLPTPLPDLHKAYGVTLDLQSVDTQGWIMPEPYIYETYRNIFSDLEQR